MRTGFIIAWAFLFITGWLLSMMVTGGSPGDGTEAMTTIAGLLNVGDIEQSTAFAFLSNAFAWIKFFFSAILLWFPALWTGYSLWFYYFVCLPVVIGVIFGMFTIARGVGSS